MKKAPEQSTSLIKLYKTFINKLVWDTNSELSSIISYEEDWNYIEYTEWYGFREKMFSSKMENIYKTDTFRRFFYILHSAFSSSNNFAQFVNLLTKFLSKISYKDNFIDWIDEDIFKSYFYAYFSEKISNNEYLKNLFKMDKMEFWKNTNSNLQEVLDLNFINEIYWLYLENLEEIKKELS